MQIKNKFVYLQSQKNKVVHFFRGCGVIGSHARLRIWCREAWGFESLHPHYAKIAQLVEHNLAKVGVAGSNPVFRSIPCPGGGTGRHAGLKILCLFWRAGSSPAWGTLNLDNPLIAKVFSFYNISFLLNFISI